MAPTTLLAVVLSALLADDSILQPLQKQFRLPTFRAVLHAPTHNERENRYDVVYYGDFENAPAGMQIRASLRETPLLVGAAKVVDFPLLIECTGFSSGVLQAGYMREPKKPQNGSFLGVGGFRRYDTTKFKYEVKIQFETATGGLISTYKENKSEWLPLPSK